MKYQAIIFDLDGTLLNTLADLGNAVNRVLTRHGFPSHELEAYRFFVGDGALRLITRALPSSERDENTINTCLEEFLLDYGQNSDRETDLYRGIHDLLDKLTKAGIKLAVHSNKPQALTVKCINNYLSNWEFSAIIGQQESIPKKPDPAGAIQIANQIGIPVSSFIYVGDSGVDMKTAVSAGMLAAGALWGFRTAEELNECGAMILLSHPREVLDISS